MKYLFTIIFSLIMITQSFNFANAGIPIPWRLILENPWKPIQLSEEDLIYEDVTETDLYLMNATLMRALKKHNKIEERKKLVWSHGKHTGSVLILEDGMKGHNQPCKSFYMTIDTRIDKTVGHIKDAQGIACSDKGKWSIYRLKERGRQPVIDR